MEENKNIPVSLENLGEFKAEMDASIDKKVAAATTPHFDLRHDRADQGSVRRNGRGERLIPAGAVWGVPRPPQSLPTTKPKLGGIYHA